MSNPNNEENEQSIHGDDIDTDALLLNRSFLYQNKSTQSASGSTLSARQLCRILSPAVAGTTANVTPDSLVIGYNARTQQYNAEGWKAAKTVPVLREACMQWYYCTTENARNGPVSCRALAKLLHEKHITLQTQVWSSSFANTENEKEDCSWKSINELPHLKAALHAFDTPLAPFSSMDNTKSSTHSVANGNGGKQLQPTTYDASVMTFDDSNGASLQTRQNKEVQDELEAFLNSTGGGAGEDEHVQIDDDEEEVYESDGGTVYAKCPRSGNWVHSDLVPKKEKPNAQQQLPKPLSTTTQPTKSKKRKRPKFSAKHSRNWIYVQGLPQDCNEEELVTFFSKVGIIDLDPETQAPKVKLYRHGEGTNKGTVKGDASICYARPESVELALQLLDEAPFRPLQRPEPFCLKVQRAKFEQHGDQFERRAAVSHAKRKVAKLAARQAVDWDEGDNGRISGGRRGLRIIVLKGMWDPSGLNAKTEHDALQRLERTVRTACQEWGTVEKITVFSKHPEGVVIVKFAQPAAASAAIQDYKANGIQASFWDGVTDYTVRDEEKEQAESQNRQDEFGAWLESQEVPEELRLQVEGQS